MATREQIREFVNRTRPRDWYGQCAGLTYRTIADNGGYAPDIYPSAYAAYLAATIESRNPAEAPPGAIHYWDYTGTDDRGHINRWGHVAVDIDGGGRNVLSATGYAHEWWGVRAGLITVAAQTARGMPYLGWSRLYGRRNRLTIGPAVPAGGGAKPFEPKKILEDTVRNPIINVIPKYGERAANGTVHIGRDDGTFEALQPPFHTNIRGILSVTFLGGEDGTIDKIPTISVDDFAAVERVWEQMCRGRTDSAAVWSHPIQAQNSEGVPQRRPDGSPIVFTAAGYSASTNAQVAALREALKALAVGQGMDPQTIEEAAERGAAAALERLTLVPKVE